MFLRRKASASAHSPKSNRLEALPLSPSTLRVEGVLLWLVSRRSASEAGSAKKVAPGDRDQETGGRDGEHSAKEQFIVYIRICIHVCIHVHINTYTYIYTYYFFK